VPCFKLGIILNNTKAPSLFTKSGATGVYFQVIKEGFIAQGDVAQVINNAANSVTVQALFKACYDRDFEGSQVLATASKLLALTPQWQQKVAKKLSQLSVG
jgi:MOSC domain-containing protein YiiM